jgi:hypothetical protein
MTDVVKIAKVRVAALQAQIVKLDDFIDMAETLLKYSLPKSNKAPVTDDEKPAESTGSTYDEVLRPLTEGSDTDAKRKDLPVRKLKAGERVLQSRTTHSEPPPKKRSSPLGRPHL